MRFQLLTVDGPSKNRGKMAVGAGSWIEMGGFLGMLHYVIGGIWKVAEGCV